VGSIRLNRRISEVRPFVVEISGQDKLKNSDQYTRPPVYPPAANTLNRPIL
jgi:hypothetical protein